MTEAASRPRSLTDKPFSRAQARTCALLGLAIPSATTRDSDFTEESIAPPAADCPLSVRDRLCRLGAFADAESALLEPFSTGCVGSCLLETTNCTLYIAPSRRIASSR